MTRLQSEESESDLFACREVALAGCQLGYHSRLTSLDLAIRRPNRKHFCQDLFSHKQGVELKPDDFFECSEVGFGPAGASLSPVLLHCCAGVNHSLELVH